jgi:hypothetical protein
MHGFVPPSPLCAFKTSVNHTLLLEVYDIELYSKELTDTILLQFANLVIES